MTFGYINYLHRSKKWGRRRKCQSGSIHYYYTCTAKLKEIKKIAAKSNNYL